MNGTAVEEIGLEAAVGCDTGTEHLLAQVLNRPRRALPAAVELRRIRELGAGDDLLR